MSELENRLSQILDEHQHESGLHMIGGRTKLLHRLVHFCEQELKQEWYGEPRPEENPVSRTA